MLRRALALLLGTALAAIGLATSASATIDISIDRTYNPTLTNEDTLLHANVTTDCQTAGAINYAWNFNDGSGTSDQTDPNIHHTWNEAGDYSVTLTATDPCGKTASASYPEHVLNDVAPVAAFTTLQADLVVYADPSASHDDDPVSNGAQTPIEHYNWNWGDGTTDVSSDSNSHGLISHHYTQAGTYTITVTATDSAKPANTSAAVTKVVTVGPVVDPWNWDEDTSSAVTYRGDWSPIDCPRDACSPNKLEHRSTTRGSKAYFHFTGTEAKVIGTTGKRAGVVRVFVDGVFQQRVDLYSNHLMDGVIVCDTGVLASGSHTVRLVVRHNDQRVNIDGFYWK